MTEGMMNALKNNDTAAFSDAAKKSPGYSPLSKAAMMYAKVGVTSVDEVLKLVEMVSDDAPNEVEVMEQGDGEIGED